MDNIANKIGDLYNHSTYSEKNGGSIFMTVLILFVFFIALSYYYVMAQAKPIKDNWVNERCSPAVMPFAGLINKPEGQSAFDFTGENFSFCTQNIIKDINMYNNRAKSPDKFQKKAMKDANLVFVL